MSTILGLMGLPPDTTREFMQTMGQRAIFDAANEVYERHSRDVAQAASVFVLRDTEDFKFRYMLPGGGEMQEANSDGRAKAIRPSGYFDVSLPLKSWRDQLAADRIDWHYMLPVDLEQHVLTVMNRYKNTYRRQILKALFTNTSYTFPDTRRGDLTIQPLANGDATVYPPVIGTDTEATDNHYLAAGYLTAAISDANNPLNTMLAELDEHFGADSGGSPVAFFINPAETAKLEALTDFVSMTWNNVTPAITTDTLNTIPTKLLNGKWRLIGTYRGAWVIEWRWIPATYILGLNTDVDAPLMRRTDPSDTGLSPDLKMVSASEREPWTESHYEARFGLAVCNRLNGVVMHLTAGSYTIPTTFVD